MWEHAIIPISFKNYDEYVDILNEYAQDGYEFIAKIRDYDNSPVNGVTTHDWVCKIKIDLIDQGLESNYEPFRDL